jgi:adenylate cyclase
MPIRGNGAGIDNRSQPETNCLALEIERKFLVSNDGWRPALRVRHIQQAYLSGRGPVSVRVRSQDGVGTLTVKGEREGIARDEFEYEIPATDAADMLRLAALPPIVKKRHELTFGGKLWQIDVFEGHLAGLVLAEIELVDEHELFARPDWLGREVTNDRRYRNSALVEGGHEVLREMADEQASLA